MAILAFQKPEKVIMLESTSSFGKFEFRPLEPGFGMTVGNALRRILLSSLEGYAITTVKVAGVDHEFAAIPGVMEGMIDIILNLKQVRFIRTVDNQDAEKVAGVDHEFAAIPGVMEGIGQCGGCNGADGRIYFELPLVLQGIESRIGYLSSGTRY